MAIDADASAFWQGVFEMIPGKRITQKLAAIFNVEAAVAIYTAIKRRALTGQKRAEMRGVSIFQK